MTSTTDTRREGRHTHSYWLEGLAGSEPRPLEGAIPADVAVLGGGFTGLATAYFLKRADPALRVVVLEAQTVGAGASGSSAGMVTTHFGLGLSTTAAMFGRDRARQGHAYTEQAVELVERLVRHNRIDCDYERPGLLRVATTEAAAQRLRQEVQFAQRLGLRGIDWIDDKAARQQFETPRLHGAWSEARCGLLHPGKLLQGMREVVERMGAVIYEGTPGLDLQRKLGRIFVRTPKGGVLTEKVALATNAYSHRIGPLRNKQTPVFTYVVMTEPLRPAQLDRIGWARRQGVEDARHFARFCRLTQDNRLLLGGRDVVLSFRGNMDRDLDREAFQRLERDLDLLFPALGRPRISHRWGGPISVPLQPVPALGFVGNERIVYSLGCMGHGLALAHLNGWTMADLLRHEKTERTAAFFVNRTVLPWPPEPLRLAMSLALRAILRAEDAWVERGLEANPPVPLRPRSPSPEPDAGPAKPSEPKVRSLFRNR